MSKYLWCEDSKSGYQFWRAIFGVLFPVVLSGGSTQSSPLFMAPASPQTFIPMHGEDSPLPSPIHRK